MRWLRMSEIGSRTERTDEAIGSNNVWTSEAIESMIVSMPARTEPQTLDGTSQPSVSTRAEIESTGAWIGSAGRRIVVSIAEVGRPIGVSIGATGRTARAGNGAIPRPSDSSRPGGRSDSEQPVGVMVHVDRSLWQLRSTRAMWVRRREAWAIRSAGDP